MDELTRWIAAEQDGSWDEADALFAGVASRHLGLHPAPPGLTARVMAAIPQPSAGPWTRAIGDLAGSWWGRAAVAASLGVLGVALSAVPAGRVLEAAPGLVEMAAGLVHLAAASLAAAFGVWVAAWTLLASLGRVAAVVSTTSAVAALIAVNLLLACVACAGLLRLLPPREECS
jgi:hypothetical protein